MEEEEEGKPDRPQLLLEMFDSYWFHHLVLLETTTAPSSAPSSPATTSLETDHPVEFLPTTAQAEAQEKVDRPRLLPVTSLRRSLSQEVPAAATSISPPLAFTKRHHHHRKLHTIHSGKKHQEEEDLQKGPREENNRGSSRGKGKGAEKSRSLSELEFQELKGFMDLGFTFSEEEAADPKLVSIVPGLQRLGKKKEAAAEEEEPSVARPYLSEAWAAEEARMDRQRRREEEHALRNWRIPAAGDGADLKNHIRHWAHTVASAVR